MKCYGDSDSYGCAAVDTCMEAGYWANEPEGIWCSNHCPKTCLPDEIQCPGYTDENGCQVEPDTCIPSVNKGWGWNPDTQESVDCAGSCPVTCNWATEVHCHSGWDSYGCEMAAFCAPITEGCPMPTQVVKDLICLISMYFYQSEK